MIRFAGFDVNFQAARKALNRTVRGFLAAALATQQTRFTVTLPSVNLTVANINLGTLTIDILDGEITALRPVGTTHHGVETDFSVVGSLGLTGASLSVTIGAQTVTVPIPPVSATLRIPFERVGLDVDVTPAGIPTALVLGLRNANLRPIQLSSVQPAALTPVLQFLLNVVSTLVSVGINIATSLVPRIPITVKPMIDAFSLFGIQLHRSPNPANDSPFITALGAAPDEALVVATDFARVSPPPAGDASQLALLVSPAQNVAVTLNQGIINQGIDQAIGLGFIPSVFPGGGFRFHVKWVEAALLGAAAAARHTSRGGFPASTFFHPTTGAPLGALQIGAELRAKRGKCWCKVKVKIEIDATVWPYVEVTATPPVPTGPGTAGTLVRQSDVHLRMFFDATATVNVSGYLIMLIDLIFGPILVPLLFLTSQIANAVISSYLPYRRTFAQNGPTAFTLTASSAKVNAFITFALDFNVSAALRGQGDLRLDEFTGFRLVDDPVYQTLTIPDRDKVDVKVDYDADSITIEDGVIRLGANLIR